MTKVVIVSVPVCEPIPLVAPALLSNCLKDANINAVGLDFSIEFTKKFYNKPYWDNLKILLSNGYVNKEFDYKRSLIDIFKFTKQTLLKIKKEHNPTHIGLSIFTAESINFSYILIHSIRKHLPGVKIVLGGRGIESKCNIENRPHYEKYNDHGMADLIVVGDAETAFADALHEECTGLYFATKQTQQDLDRIPSPDWSAYDMSLYKDLSDADIIEATASATMDPRALSITASKGCVRKCTFCDVASFWPNFIYRDGEKVAQDIITNYRNTGIRNFEFTDNLINGSITHYRKMNVVLANTIPKEIKYKGYAIFREKNSMPEEDFELAARAGCEEWGVGIESGSERVRYEMRKKFTNEDMDFGIKQLHKNGIFQTWCLIVGYPTETEKDFEETLDLLKRYHHLNKNKMIQLNITQPFQLNYNTPLMQESEFTSKFDWTAEGDDSFHSRYFWVTPANPENNFSTRYNRWHRIMELAETLDYSHGKRMMLQLSKWRGELESLKEIYEQSHKKVIFINRVD